MSVFVKKTMRRLFMPLTVMAALAAGLSLSQAQEPPRQARARASMPLNHPVSCVWPFCLMRHGWLKTPAATVRHGTVRPGFWPRNMPRLLGVKLQTVPVSHETKVPVLASNQADLSITALAETPERLKVVDFVIYSQTSVCMFGRADNPKFSGAKKVDDLNNPDITIAYLTGSAEENWVKSRFPLAKYRAVGGTGVAPVEEIVAKRADAAPINRIPYVPLSRKVKGLAALPAENNCQGSMEKASPVGLAIDKNQPALLEWLRDVAKGMQAKLDAAESVVVRKME